MFFNNPKIRSDFIEMYDKDIEGAKFKIGEIVVFSKILLNEPLIVTGKVETVGSVEEGVYEYLIEGAPVLAWEHELTKG